jgi:hypothetical protein
MMAYHDQILTRDDAEPIVHRPMGIPIMAGCDTAWNVTRVCVTHLALRCMSPGSPKTEGRRLLNAKSKGVWLVGVDGPTDNANV